MPNTSQHTQTPEDISCIQRVLEGNSGSARHRYDGLGSSFPRLFHGKPDWPSKDDQHLFWVGIHSKFKFAHHPAPSERASQNAKRSEPERDESSFCQPRDLMLKLLGVLRDSSGGSILISGYRGTGKTSLANTCLSKWKAELNRDGFSIIESDPIAKARMKFGGELEKKASKLANLTAPSERPTERPFWWRGSAKTDAENLERERRQLGEDMTCLQEQLAKCLPAKSPEQLVRVNVNLSTVASAHEVLLLTFEAFAAELRCLVAKCKPSAAKTQASAAVGTLSKLLGDVIYNKEQLRATRTTQRPHERPGIKFGSIGDDGHDHHGSSHQEHTIEREALSRFQAMLVEHIKAFRGINDLQLTPAKGAPPSPPFKPRLVFVFDELDKLLPAPPAHSDKHGHSLPSQQAGKLEQLQRIVAELKFFLSESESHQIFIAGKDVDDSWDEDQNKGEGLFESIFVCNIYVPSIFTAQLEPCSTGAGAVIDEHDRKEFYQELARELGIPHNSWAYRTSLLILPYLAEFEVYALLLRAYHTARKGLHHDIQRVSKIHGWLCKSYTELPIHLRVGDAVQAGDWTLPPPPETAALRGEDFRGGVSQLMSERTCRRLRILLEYLTYKGRGIPRKILREFYAMVQDMKIVGKNDPGYQKITTTSVEPETGKKSTVRTLNYVLAFEQHHLQKMNFYAGIVEYLDQNLPDLRGINDKGRVSIYHIIDYILKFYSTGFSQRDIEHANFMTTREEFFPSRQLASLIIRIMEGRLWKRKDSRSPDFRLLHGVVHDLSVMFLRYAPEQLELRHTRADFRDEIDRLQTMLSEVSRTTPEQRLEPVHAQIRLGRILEMIGNHFEARLAYYKALRWLRMDIEQFESTSNQAATGTLTITAQFLIPFVSAAIDCLIAVGRLHEEMGEYRSALQMYGEAEQLHRRHGVSAELIPTYSRTTSTEVPEPLEDDDREIREQLLKTLVDIASVDRWRRSMDTIIRNRAKILPIAVDGKAGGLVDALNHSAVAYSKMWERVSGNECLLKALIYLDSIHDEYGVVDQMFLIGQIMVRCRDFRAAALWYMEALRRIYHLQKHANEVNSQSGTKWQTPSMSASTHASILASLGDVYFATGGLALLPIDLPAAEITEEAKRKGISIPAQLRWHVRDAMGEFVRRIGAPVFEDRIEEYFLTSARFVYQSIGEHQNSNDVYLRQMEVRLDLFEQSLGWLDQVGTLVQTPSAVPSPLVREVLRHKYEVLNSWSGFWRGARVMMHRYLVAVTALTRNANTEWGRVTDFRRMGTLMRLAAEILRELALHPIGAPARRLLGEQSAYNNQNAVSHPKIRDADAFYTLFVEPTTLDGNADETTDELKDKTMAEAHLGIEFTYCALDSAELEKEMKARSERIARPAASSVSPIEERAAVNRAAEDIRTIFGYISDRLDLIGEINSNKIPELDKVGFRSPLFRLNGSKKPLHADLSPASTEPTKQPTPLAHVLHLCEITEPKNEAAIRDFRLLTLSEKAGLTGYLCYRDCIPDYGYASTVLSLGDLYLTALYKLGHYSTAPTSESGERPIPAISAKELPVVIEHLTEYAKRFTMKAIDVLRRERDQNRNTYHLISEAWFNLGDILLIRLALIDDWEFQTNPFLAKHDLEPRIRRWNHPQRLFGNFNAAINKQHWNHALSPDTGDDDTRAGLGSPGDMVSEDLRRQIWDAYRQGLVMVQTEMDEYASRYRFPSEVYYSHRNVMDAVLHFRICRAARARHSGARHEVSFTAGPGGSGIGFSISDFRRIWEELSTEVARYESPQKDSIDWAIQLDKLLSAVNHVRTDRGPLMFSSDAAAVNAAVPSHRKLTWLQPDKIHSLPRFNFFDHLCRDDR